MTETANRPPPPASLPPLAQGQMLANPYPLYAMLRGTNPVFRVPIPGYEGPGVFVLTRHGDVHTVLRDGRFSVERRRAHVVEAYADRFPLDLIQGPGGLRSMLLMDPPDHTRVRGLVNKAFTPRRVAALAPRIEALVDELLAPARDGGALDVMLDFAEPLPAIVIAELLGVPAEDHRRFKRWSTELINAVAQPVLFSQGPNARSGEVAAKLEPLLDYLGETIAERRRQPRGDLISAMIEAQEERDALTDAELRSTSLLLLLAGHETTTNLIGNGLLALLRNPEELERLRREPGLLENGLEELLRYDSPVQGTGRIPLEDVELGGTTLPARALVMTGIGAANRDPEVFREPDRLDLARSDARQHLAFGFGTHFCLGAGLARLEGRLAFRGLLERFSRIDPAVEEPARRPNFFLRGLASLPVEVVAA